MYCSNTKSNIKSCTEELNTSKGVSKYPILENDCSGGFYHFGKMYNYHIFALVIQVYNIRGSIDSPMFKEDLTLRDM